MEKTYKITGKTNGWIAQRDTLFKGKEYITIESGLTLKEAQEKMLNFFNEDYNTGYSNWGLVRCNHGYNSWSHKDGTRGYDYDSRYYYIEEEVADELPDEPQYCDDDVRLSLELYRDGDGFGIWLSDDFGGSGIEATGSTPEEVANNIAAYIADYFYKRDNE